MNFKKEDWDDCGGGDERKFNRYMYSVHFLEFVSLCSAQYVLI